MDESKLTPQQREFLEANPNLSPRNREFVRMHPNLTQKQLDFISRDASHKLPANTMEAMRYPWGKIVVDEDGITLSGLLTRERIPYQNISSVSVNKLLGRLTIETGARTRWVQPWNSSKLSQLAAAIESHLKRSLA